MDDQLSISFSLHCGPRLGQGSVEIKRTLKPRPKRGFHAGCADLKPKRSFVVYPGTERYRLGADAEAVPLADLAGELAEASGPG